MSNLPPQGPSSGPGNFVAGIPPPVEDDERNLIGVPSGYALPGDPTQIFTNPIAAFTPRRPQYYAGDEIAPGSWGGEAIVELQLALEAANLLSPPYQKGVYDAKTKEAYASLLAHANYNAISSTSALYDLQERVKQYGKTDTKTREPLVVSISNPEQVAELASQVAVRTIGRRLSSEEASRYAQAYNELERSYQTSRYEMSGSGLPGGPGGEVVDPGSPATFTETQIRQNNPEEVSQQNYRQNFNSFLSLLNKDFG